MAHIYIFHEFLTLICFGVPLNAEKHGDSQQIIARLSLATRQYPTHRVVGIRPSINA